MKQCRKTFGTLFVLNETKRIFSSNYSLSVKFFYKKLWYHQICGIRVLWTIVLFCTFSTKNQIMIMYSTEFIQLSSFITFIRKDRDFKGKRLSWWGESFFNDLSQKLWEVKEFWPSLILISKYLRGDIVQSPFFKWGSQISKRRKVKRYLGWGN